MRARRWRGGLALAAAILTAAACAGPVSGPTPAALAHPGFDTWRYPGDEVMRAWREASPYRWVGYYLPAPCHRGTSWVGKRETLERMGWGTAVLYVGQQTFEGVPEPEVEPDTVVCSRTLLTAEQGERDARDAIEQARREGFPDGTIIYLDIERMEHATPPMVAYYRAWIRGVVADGRYRPGTYVHRRNAAELYLLAQTTAREAGGTADPPFWVAGGSGFSLEARPEMSGVPFARIWQGALDVEREWAGIRLQIDENVAIRPSPSTPEG